MLDHSDHNQNNPPLISLEYSPHTPASPTPLGYQSNFNRHSYQTYYSAWGIGSTNQIYDSTACPTSGTALIPFLPSKVPVSTRALEIRKLLGNQSNSPPSTSSPNINPTSASAHFKHNTIPCPLNPALTHNPFASGQGPTKGTPSFVAPIMPVHSCLTGVELESPQFGPKYDGRVCRKYFEFSSLMLVSSVLPNSLSPSPGSLAVPPPMIISPCHSAGTSGDVLWCGRGIMYSYPLA